VFLWHFIPQTEELELVLSDWNGPTAWVVPSRCPYNCVEISSALSYRRRLRGRSRLCCKVKEGARYVWVKRMCSTLL
jgi:hypothetical protein